jgi:hypothetical protein
MMKLKKLKKLEVEKGTNPVVEDKKLSFIEKQLNVNLKKQHIKKIQSKA